MANKPGPASSNARADAPAIEDARLEGRRGVHRAGGRRDEPLSRPARGTSTTTLLVAMSLFHLYAAVDIVPAQVLRPVHVGFMLVLVFLLFPVSRALPRPADVVGRRAGACSASRRSPTCSPAATSSGTATSRRARATASSASRSSLLVLEACRRTSGWIMTGRRSGCSSPTRSPGPWLPGQWAHRGYDVASLNGLPLPDARGHLRHRGRRVVDADHPVHDLRRVPAAVGRRASSSSTGASPRWAASTRARAAPSCSRRSCSAVRRARASRPR